MSTRDAHTHIQDRAKVHSQALFDLIKANGLIEMPRHKDGELFEFMAETVIGQQLSKIAANSIWERVICISKIKTIILADFFQEEYIDAIKSCGVSGNKAKALVSLSNHFAENPTFEKKLKSVSHEELTKCITKLWGFGQWSAEMISIFYFNNPDVWSNDDVSLLRGIKFLTGEKQPSQEFVRAFTSQFIPFRSYLALHIWRGLDNRVLPA